MIYVINTFKSKAVAVESDDRAALILAIADATAEIIHDGDDQEMQNPMRYIRVVDLDNNTIESVEMIFRAS